MELNTGVIVALLMAIPVGVKVVDKLVDGVLNKRKNHTTNGYLKDLSDNQLKISLSLERISATMDDIKTSHHRDLTGIANRIVDKLDDGVISRLESIRRTVEK